MPEVAVEVIGRMQPPALVALVVLAAVVQVVAHLPEQLQRSALRELQTQAAVEAVVLMLAVAVLAVQA